MKYLFLLFLPLFYIGSTTKKSAIVATTDSTIRNGNWSNPSVWSSNEVPNGGLKNVIISRNTTIMIDTTVSVNTVLVRQGAVVMWGINKGLNGVYLDYRADSVSNSSLYMFGYNCQNTYPPPSYTLKTSCTKVIKEEVQITDRVVKNGYWSSIQTFNTNAIPNSTSRNVYVSGFARLKIDTSVVVNRLLSYEAYISWTKGASLNGINFQNYNVY
ncbi:hypothetical protein VB796_21095 [Arcicella sp. LKC2W]|uniref:hypothetical protein n=1 Tax=Arcicella sp. LKC2W TaxID=2984198 RepID=UPI002B1EAB64|nr:hypothetical protein [Arcicella sp. LKC2W]MEA5461577.1 hypothetical protein [Arcicella sp. LKC2W]